MVIDESSQKYQKLKDTVRINFQIIMLTVIVLKVLTEEKHA